MNTRIAPWKRKPAKHASAKTEKVGLIIPKNISVDEKVEIVRQTICGFFPQLNETPCRRAHQLLDKGIELGLYKKWIKVPISSTECLQTIDILFQY